MVSINNILFKISHLIVNRDFFSIYRYLLVNQNKKYNDLKEQQEKSLRKLVVYSYQNIPYYSKLFDNLEIDYRDIRKIEDLKKLPILTKKTINENWNDFIPKCLQSEKHTVRSTGGTTGTPFEYRLSNRQRYLGGALLYRGWSRGGYKLGDKMVFLAGSSIGVNSQKPLLNRLQEIGRNIIKLSSFDMSDEQMEFYYKKIIRFQPSFIRGYPSSIYYFAKWLENNCLRIPGIQACFTTSEQLFPHMREKIELVFDCDVFDGYGLFDGGVTAFECSAHNGLHIDTEAAILEIVDGDGNQIGEGEGSILATSLYNYSMPFIRYDTGDRASISSKKCSCGLDSLLLNSISGRSVDVLKTPEGKVVHGWFFLYIFWENMKGIKEYQVVQNNLYSITIYIVKDDKFEYKQIDKIKSVIKEKSKKWIVEILFVEKIDRSSSGKFKFIINNMLEGKS